MTRSAKYLVAQYVSDPFRNEPKNVGVFVSIGDERTARFIGEDGSRMDGKKLRWLPYPDVYRQWVTEWWRTLADSPDPLTELQETSGHHYRVTDGGEVANIGADSIHDVTSFLFTSLVSEGIAQAYGGEDFDEGGVTAPLAQDISRTLIDLKILADDDAPLVQVQHPIRLGVTVAGHVYNAHSPTYTQDNGELILMEPVDLTAKRRAAVKDHAGWAAYMFGDVRAAKMNGVKTISLVRSTAEDEKDKSVAYALAMLASQSQIVNWFSDKDRGAFLQERAATAHG